ncbi:hypothetical protein TIFTF001_000130 [Ficus carica]|uniref:Uncharacterized protein n=1 Tax=Ficus carica TaxID=3494 RepID=A0AA87ZC00_FICCA|nr:hypothetical protein TIFTF001_000130 [Ficus carica]
MAACLSWTSDKVAIARLIAIPSYAMMESAVSHSWSSDKVAIFSPPRSNCGCNLITTDGMPNEEDDDKARLATATSQSQQG